MKRSFDTFGVMIDMSRNAVMSIDGLKRFLPILKKFGYNSVMLYTEDTYEVDGEPYFGYMRGRYTKAEMKEIDAFAAGLGMTVIPCIQTLAHLNAIFRWGQYPRDCDDILMADDDRTYELIEHMFATLSECFVSRRIHIGMDEAHNLGLGAHRSKYGDEAPLDIMTRHLGRVCDIAKKYGYEVMMWSDMYFRPWNNGNARIPECTVPREVVEAFNKDVIPVYWDYFQTEQKNYEGMIRNHKQFSDKTWFAGGSWSWNGMIPSNTYTIETMVPAVNACRAEGIRNMFMTMWGDDGAECSHFSQLPSLLYIAEYARGNSDEASIKAKFKRIVGIDFDEFINIDRLNDVVPYDDASDRWPRNPSKYMLYADCFNDYLDYTVKEGGGEHYREYAEKLHKTAKSSRKYGYVLESAAKLSSVLEIKYELGLRTRKAYEAGDKEALKALAQNEYTEVIKRIKAFGVTFEKQWITDNKPHGFDVQHHRIGALIYRLEACRRRILDYTAGRIDRIEELDEKLLPFGRKEESINLNKSPVHATTNLLYTAHVPG